MSHALNDVESWLRDVVVRLNLCPFAAAPLRLGAVRLVQCDDTGPEELLRCVAVEADLLVQTPAREIETSLIVFGRALRDFADFNDFFDPAEALLRELSMEGVVQLVGFHPDYRFADHAEDDPANFSNRAPWPVVQLLREESVSTALDAGADADRIVAHNQRTLRGMSAAELLQFFPRQLSARRRQ